MSEIGHIDNPFCPHGKVPAFCEICNPPETEESRVLRPAFEKKGTNKTPREEGLDLLPKMDESQYKKKFAADSGVKDPNHFQVFDFVGFLKREGETTIFKDVLVTNGILKSKGKPGIHLGTDGVADSLGTPADSPEQITQYHIYFSIPPHLQTPEQSRVTKGKERFTDFVRLKFNPQNDPVARDRARRVHMDSVKALLTMDLRYLDDFEIIIRHLERKYIGKTIYEPGAKEQLRKTIFGHAENIIRQLQKNTQKSLELAKTIEDRERRMREIDNINEISEVGEKAIQGITEKTLEEHGLGEPEEKSALLQGKKAKEFLRAYLDSFPVEMPPELADVTASDIIATVSEKEIEEEMDRKFLQWKKNLPNPPGENTSV